MSFRSPQPGNANFDGTFQGQRDQWIGNEIRAGRDIHIYAAVEGRSAEYRPGQGDRFEKPRQDLLDSYDDDILASLAFPQMFDRRNNVEQPHANTCRWILDLKEYQCWEAQPRGLLWIKGKPGAGKSTLMSFLYHTLREERQAEHGVHLDFFFSARGTDMQRTPLGMLRSLLNRLFRQDPSIRPPVRELYREKCTAFGRGERSWEWQRRELEPLLAQAIVTSAQQQQVTVFIDALDEAGEESARETARYFHNINDRVASASAVAKICISCRHYPIPCTVRGVEVVVEKHNGDDITAFVHDRLDLDGRTLDDTPDLEHWQELGTDLVRRADGVFQWVRLIVPIVEKSIDDGESPEDVRQWLQEVPEELGDVYEHILRNVVDRRHRSQSFQLFQWVCLAERPLSVTEMRYALAAKDAVPLSPRVRCCETRGFVKTDKLMKVRVKSLSGGLVEVVRDHDGDDGDDGDDDQERVQVIHQSINDFFLSRGLTLLASLQHEVSAVSSVSRMAFKQAEVVGQCQANLYRSCLNYLATEDVEVNDRHRTGFYEENEERKEIVSSWPLVHYATINLFVHGEKATSYRGGGLTEQTRLLEQIMANWIRVYKVFDEYSSKCPRLDTTVLHAAASANLLDIVEHLIHNFDVNIQDEKGYTPLHLAARWGHQSVAETLFHAGASIDMKTKQEQTPLVLAAGNGHLELVQWLLCQGANLDEAAGESGNALQAAAADGNAVMVKVLLDAGADVHAQGGEYGNALQAASYGGHEKVVQMLVDNRADLDVLGKYYDDEVDDRLEGNSLQAASYDGHEKVVQMLIDKGADVHAQGGYYGNALVAASVRGHEKVVQMLIDKGADVNAQGGEYGNALQAASYGGHEKVVQMLLDKGADVNAQGGEYGNALQAASAGGHEKVVKILLKRGAKAV
ncbi:hypothetical protein H2198_006269 [Neophaeococcomyces mojaviensis]|uniref:Uncharacterized protein n=1 Tax=Neophaeococcomyces mojaviensis TaxID=3383035 RepID=A0ACC3A3E1_9EURO|nr:hypothetical protein H2198_006269 [Knufia sp. JES_112]